MLSQNTPSPHLFIRDLWFELRVSFLLLLLPSIAVFWLDLIGVVAVLVVAFAIGRVMLPKHVWTVWLAGILAWAVGGLSWALWGDPTPPGQEETAVSLVAETIIFTGMLIALPVSIGRLIGTPPGRFRRGIYDNRVVRVIRDNRIRRAIHDLQEW